MRQLPTDSVTNSCISIAIKLQCLLQINLIAVYHQLLCSPTRPTQCLALCMPCMATQVLASARVSAVACACAPLGRSPGSIVQVPPRAVHAPTCLCAGSWQLSTGNPSSLSFRLPSSCLSACLSTCPPPHLYAFPSACPPASGLPDRLRAHLACPHIRCGLPTPCPPPSG